MKTSEALTQMDNKVFIETVYRYAYRRCSTSHEAEELCSEILLGIIKAVKRQTEITNFHSFVWTVARRVYADHCEVRNRGVTLTSYENKEFQIASQDNEIEAWLEEITSAEQTKQIMREISFLAKSYRDVMVMYYLDERSIKEIAAALDLSETAVKQRLFSARAVVKKEVTTMSTKNISLKPKKLYFFGTGNPNGNDPCEICEHRSFSQNLVYLCKDKPRTAKEISEELGVPMLYVEEELELQCKGQNGEYGLLRKLENGKYITNVIMMDYEEFEQVNSICDKYLPAISETIKKSLSKHKDMILSFPYLNTQTDLRFLLWHILQRSIWQFKHSVYESIAKKHFSDITPTKRPFSTTAVACNGGQDPELYIFGNNGTDSNNLCGYRFVFVSNLNNKYLNSHFWAGHNMSHDPQMLLSIRSIGGLDASTLSAAEKEVAAKAIECGYLRKNGNTLEPKMIVIEKKNREAFFALSQLLIEGSHAISEQIADEQGAYMRKHIPVHLLGEFEYYTHLIAGAKLHYAIIEQCIADGILYVPEQLLGAEGMLMIVEKE